MSSLIFRAAARVLMPLLIVLAAFLLLRGHNEPGGGFVAGLVVSVAFVLRLLAEGTQAARAALIVNPSTLLTTGLILALASGFFPILLGRPFLTSCWIEIGPPTWRVPISTPLFFDIGVFFVVVGVVLAMTFNLAEE